ncbi:MAG: exodeoxyribonuclease VII large subunit [Rhodospirillaceae bacterium]|jgi:exodeoxyribonuclease VII large subunit|nr:exodeoxyribonuclease VII large subunit [Rhodospirillaceae bacterium]MDP6645314.1 exodeoxyribonuclease VII large subunit [Rhodospirillales bacterium]
MPSELANMEAGAGNVPIYSVSEISQSLKRTVEEAFAHIRVRGEISGLSRPASGHMYLSLKDDKAVLDGVCWRGTVGRLGLTPEDGLEVIVSGRLSTYPGRSRYQIVIESMEVAGEGALLKLLEERRKKLLAEGLFDEQRKRDLPFLPEVIGVVTSPTGAVIRDILHRLRDRFPRHVLVWPVIVQGEGAAAEVAAAIDGFNRLASGGPVPRPDLLIVARGGGSLEDLWAFNEEVVVRAAAASEIPLISAVGHETDTTLIDFASDRRAPTPTAAAEMAVPVRAELMAQLSDDASRLMRASARILDGAAKDVGNLARRLPRPAQLVEEAQQRLDERTQRLTRAKDVLLQNRKALVERLGAGLISPARQIAAKQDQFKAKVQAWSRAFGRVLEIKHADLERLARVLDSVSYQRVLDRGFALVTDGEANPVLSAAAAEPGADWRVHFHDGAVDTKVSGDAPSKPEKPKPRKKPRKKPQQKPQQKPQKKSAKPPDDAPGDPQGTLL